ncbi:hypothetical protein [Lancefieldella parvula]|uniref:hypothetical protein n=1 Tax=Lancefieldella parvula TaxID=1382 RepID=UPI0028898479|nr:hypothetical protein [Lancefieldella parvula]
MPNRKEIAASLRELRHKTYYREEIVESITDAISTSNPVNTFREPEDVYELLADLIDPICHDFGGEEGTNGESYDFACSTCGWCGDVTKPNYCPHCGSRVVRDEG